MTKILIAEDNESNMKLMYDLLSSQNYDVHKAFDGEEALQKLKNNNYDLLILDIQMPKKSGYDVLKEINTPIKVIIVSACAMEKDIELAKNIGYLNYLTKPIKVFAFLEKVKAALNEK